MFLSIRPNHANTTAKVEINTILAWLGLPQTLGR